MRATGHPVDRQGRLPRDFIAHTNAPDSIFCPAMFNFSDQRRDKITAAVEKLELQLDMQISVCLDDNRK